MRHNFDEIIDRRNSDCKKYEKANYPEDIIPMWIADTDFAAPKEIVDAIKERAEHACYGYPVETFEFEKAVARWEKVRFNWDVNPNWVKYASGVLPGMMIAIRTLTEPGDQIVIQTPVYPPFHALVKNNGRQLVTNELIKGEDGTYSIDFEDLENKLSSSRAKLLFLCNPHNPVMRAYTLEELTRIGEICIKHNVIVVSDEIHCDIVYKENKHIPFGSISKEFEQNCIVMVNPSKTFNIAGFRVGAMIIANDRIRDNIENGIVNNKAYGRTIFGMLTLTTAYTKCDYYADEMVEYLQGNRDYLVDFLKNRIPQIKIGTPEATYLFWLDCKGLGFETQAELKSFMREKAKLALNDGETFGAPGTGYMRMNIACPRATLVEALNRLEKAIKGLGL